MSIDIYSVNELMDLPADVGQLVHLAESKLKMVPSLEHIPYPIIFECAIGLYDWLFSKLVPVHVPQGVQVLLVLVLPVRGCSVRKVRQSCHHTPILMPSASYHHYIFIASCGVLCLCFFARSKNLSVKVASWMSRVEFFDFYLKSGVGLQSPE